MLRGRGSWIFISGFFLITGAAQGVYAAHGEQPSPRFHLVTVLAMMAFLWHWFAEQMRPYRPTFAMDMGVFIVVLWFILMPYYLWRYERWGGLIKCLALAGIYVLSLALSWAIYLRAR